MKETSNCIILGIDGSDSARLALNVSINMAKKYDARLLIVSVCSLPSMPLLGGVPAYPHTITQFPNFSPKVPAEFSKKMEPLLKDCEDQAKKAGVKTVEHKIIAVWDTVGAGMVKEAEAEKCVVIILGSRGLTGIKRTLLGSVVDYVLKHAPCDVMIVRG